MCLQQNTETESAMATSSSRNGPGSPPWPEDQASSVAVSSRSLASIYNQWTYSYTNQVFAKGALQNGEKSIETQLTQRDLYRSPKNDKVSLLNAKFWKVYEQTHSDFLRTLWSLAKPIFVPAG